ncbi:Hypothetical protein I595_3191 [Croceitalea dokdonensis DOKDO 023]|uniref:Uncharacterized protein n=1 Tax=Croceitalea dokdonensis DOKDO 023 TaxID=1300341 RepID=A0A0P7AWJ2_9FLAO|nr:Hypothetical protein I595_3191 [Croceitalea dokdonensis DOKDO 023]
MDLEFPAAIAAGFFLQKKRKSIKSNFKKQNLPWILKTVLKYLFISIIFLC